jgi:hypothetical protein
MPNAASELAAGRVVTTGTLAKHLKRKTSRVRELLCQVHHPRLPFA